MMKKVLKYVSVLLLAVLLFLPTQSAGATNAALEGQVVFGQSFTLKSGDTMNGDLLVFGGSATIEQGATVNGSTVLFGGNLTVNGTVNGDVAITGGTASLGAAAHITGNLTTVAASLDRATGSKVDGQIYNTATSWISSGENGKIPQPVIPIVPVIDVVPGTACRPRGACHHRPTANGRRPRSANCCRSSDRDRSVSGHIDTDPVGAHYRGCPGCGRCLWLDRHRL